MKSLLEKLEQIQNEDLIAANDNEVSEKVQELVEQLNSLGFDKRPEYTIPPADTLGKGYYSSFYKHSV